jgi:hypothetical protein
VWARQTRDQRDALEDWKSTNIIDSEKLINLFLNYQLHTAKISLSVAEPWIKFPAGIKPVPISRERISQRVHLISAKQGERLRLCIKSYNCPGGRVFGIQRVSRWPKSDAWYLGDQPRAQDKGAGRRRSYRSIIAIWDKLTELATERPTITLWEPLTRHFWHGI